MAAVREIPEWEGAKLGDGMKDEERMYWGLSSLPDGSQLFLGNDYNVFASWTEASMTRLRTQRLSAKRVRMKDLSMKRAASRFQRILVNSLLFLHKLDR